MISIACLKSQSQHVNKYSIYSPFMINVFDILLDPYHWSKMLNTQLQIRFHEPSKGYKNNFPQISVKKREKQDSPRWKIVDENKIFYI